MSTYLTTGFVLKSVPWREHDRLYRVFTDKYGKLELIAAGSRKVGSKLSPHLQPFCDVELMVARGKKLDRLAAARLGKVYFKLPKTCGSMLIGAALLEFTDLLTDFEQPEPGLHALLQNALQKAASLPQDSSTFRSAARALLVSFLTSALQKVGLAVSLLRCDICKDKLREPVDYSWTRHGFCHRECLKDDPSRTTLSPTVLHWLEHAPTSELSESDNLPPTVLGFLSDYIIGHTGRPVCTLKVLRSIL